MLCPRRLEEPFLSLSRSVSFQPLYKSDEESSNQSPINFAALNRIAGNKFCALEYSDL